MAFSNPFDDPQGAFYILRNEAGTLCVSRSHKSPASSGLKPTGVL